MWSSSRKGQGHIWSSSLREGGQGPGFGAASKGLLKQQAEQGQAGEKRRYSTGDLPSTDQARRTLSLKSGRGRWGGGREGEKGRSGVALPDCTV